MRLWCVYRRINNEESGFNAVPFYFSSAYLDAVRSTGNLSSSSNVWLTYKFLDCFVNPLDPMEKTLQENLKCSQNIGPLGFFTLTFSM